MNEMARAGLLRGSLLLCLIGVAQGYVNPVLNMDFPDPCVIRTDGGHAAYAYATRGNNVNIQVAQSPDLVSWRWLGDALPIKPTVSN